MAIENQLDQLKTQEQNIEPDKFTVTSAQFISIAPSTEFVQKKMLHGAKLTKAEKSSDLSDNFL